LDRDVTETATRFLESADPSDRAAALHVILGHPEAFPSETVATAERVLAADLAAAPTESRKSLEHLDAQWDARRKERGRQERIRAVLLR
jgi:hypothetical protein